MLVVVVVVVVSFGGETWSVVVEEEESIGGDTGGGVGIGVGNGGGGGDDTPDMHTVLSNHGWLHCFFLTRGRQRDCEGENPWQDIKHTFVLWVQELVQSTH